MKTVADTKDLKKAAHELETLTNRSQQKLLEVDVLIGRAEIKAGKGKRYKTAKAMTKDIVG